MWERLVIRLVWGQKIVSSNLTTQTFMEASLMSFDPMTDKLMEIEDHLRDLTPDQRDRILGWITKDKQRANKLIERVQALQTSFDTLRVQIKYQCFDLEATRRENVQLQEQIEQLQQILENKGYYAPQDNVVIDGDYDEIPSAGEDEMRAYHGMIDLPHVGDFIHNNECDHPYADDCACCHCKEYRWRYRQQNEGSD